MVPETPQPPLHLLTIPTEPRLNEALGCLAIAHTHLELILRYCVKTIASQTIRQGLDATEGERISDLRTRIKRLFKERKATALEKNTLDALLGRAKRLSEKRNSYVHRAWSQTGAGKIIRKDEQHQWGAAPTEDEIMHAAREITQLVKEINTERLHGFIREVVLRSGESKMS